MIEKIILAITHSDDYTDYLYQTACLTNSRIIPMLNPMASELYDATGDNTIVYRCDGRYKDSQMKAPSVFAHSINRTITVLTHYYLREDGSIDIAEAEIARSAELPHHGRLHAPSAGREKRQDAHVPRRLHRG